MILETVRPGVGGDADSGLGGGTNGGGGGDGQERDRDGLNMWEDNVANVILGTEINAPLAYDPVLELHHPIIFTIGGHGRRFDIYIYIYI